MAAALAVACIFVLAMVVVALLYVGSQAGGDDEATNQ